jgi:hypothetical protein
VTVEELDLSELPASLAKVLASQEYILKMYKPTTIEADIPFNDDWWKFAYWIPKIKREFYLIAIKELDMEKAIQEKCNSYGMDYWFFTKHYKEFFRRLNWMRKNSGEYNHLGETT